MTLLHADAVGVMDQNASLFMGCVDHTFLDDEASAVNIANKNPCN